MYGPVSHSRYVGRSDRGAATARGRAGRGASTGGRDSRRDRLAFRRKIRPTVWSVVQRDDMVGQRPEIGCREGPDVARHRGAGEPGRDAQRCRGAFGFGRRPRAADASRRRGRTPAGGASRSRRGRSDSRVRARLPHPARRRVAAARRARSSRRGRRRRRCERAHDVDHVGELRVGEREARHRRARRAERDRRAQVVVGRRAARRARLPLEVAAREVARGRKDVRRRRAAPVAARAVAREAERLVDRPAASSLRRRRGCDPTRLAEHQHGRDRGERDPLHPAKLPHRVVERQCKPLSSTAPIVITFPYEAYEDPGTGQLRP